MGKDFITLEVFLYLGCVTFASNFGSVIFYLD
jgi:hypothetical protein